MAQPAPREPLPLSLTLEAHAVLVRQGDPCPGELAVATGAMFMTCVDEEGRRFGVDVLGPGDLASGPDGAVSFATVTALRRTTFRPAGRDGLASLLAERERRAAATACSLAWLGIADRLGRLMDDLADRFGRSVAGGVSIDLGLNQDDLAALLGASRESVNRAIARDRRIQPVARGRYLVRPRFEVVAEPGRY